MGMDTQQDNNLTLSHNTAQDYNCVGLHRKQHKDGFPISGFRGARGMSGSDNAEARTVHVQDGRMVGHQPSREGSLHCAQVCRCKRRGKNGSDRV
jgi:hypothetical protein